MKEKTILKSEGGFTLVELLVVLAVMVVALALFVPKLMDFRTAALERERSANEEAINKAIRQCYALEGEYPRADGEDGLRYLSERYNVALKPERFVYSYALEDGKPRLEVTIREAGGETVGGAGGAADG